MDGLITLSFGADYDRFLEAVGLNVRYAYQGWTHGRFISPMVQQAAMVVALLVYGMPVGLMLNSTLYGAAFGMFPIGWIVYWAIVLYKVCEKTGKAAVVDPGADLDQIMEVVKNMGGTLEKIFDIFLNPRFYSADFRFRLRHSRLLAVPEGRTARYSVLSLLALVMFYFMTKVTI